MEEHGTVLSGEACELRKSMMSCTLCIHELKNKKKCYSSDLTISVHLFAFTFFTGQHLFYIL